MREIDLTEYKRSGPHTLSIAERDALSDAVPSLSFTTARGKADSYHLTPGSTVGAIEIGGLSARIEPKIGITQLLSLACYAIGEVKFQPSDFNYPDAYALPDVLALALARAARSAFSRGLLHGYRTEEEALHTVRGRIRFDDQIRRRFGVPLPIEVRYDDFTDDIMANRLVKAAAHRLGRMPLRSPDARRNLGWVAGMLDNVSLVDFPRNDVPKVTFDRLNEHYRNVVELSRLVLQQNAFESRRGEVRASGFLMNMNDVFQEFLTVALREALGVSERTFGESKVDSLDAGGWVHLEPDLVWREGGRYVFVGDAKYKRVRDERVPNADLYQLLAYVTALDLPGGLLVYAKDDDDPDTRGMAYDIRNTGKRLEVAVLDLSGTLEDVLGRVGGLASKARELRAERWAA